MGADVRVLSAREAADYCGVTEKTVRNWLAAGRVAGRKVGGAYRIDADQLEPLRRQSAARGAEGPHPAGGNGAEGVRTPAESADRTGAELVQLVAKQQDQLVQLAGQVGYLQRQVQDLTARLALEAPAGGVHAASESPNGHQAHHASSLTVQAEGGVDAPAAPKRSWWRRW